MPDDEGADLPQSAKALEEHVSRRLPHVELADLLVDVVLIDPFQSTFDAYWQRVPPTDDLLLNLYATLMAQGTHMSMTEMAHSTKLTFVDRLVDEYILVLLAKNSPQTVVHSVN